MDDAPDAGKNPDDAEMYDMFMGKLEETCGHAAAPRSLSSDPAATQQRQRTEERVPKTSISSSSSAGAEVGALTREILQLAMRMGVQPTYYAPQLSRTWSDFMQWTNGEGCEAGDSNDRCIDASEAIATEELMVMGEDRPGSVSEVRRRPEVAEIYSPPRITALLPDGGLYPGVAMDLTTNDETGHPWDFDDHRQRQRARERF